MKKKLKGKLYMVEYKNQGDYGCGEEVMAVSENHAVRIVQNTLLKDGEYMSKLVDVYEVEDNCNCNDCNPEWKLDDGTILDEESQSVLNDAMNTYTNKDGLTLDEAIKRASERKNNK